MTGGEIFGAGFEGLSPQNRLRRAAEEMEAVVLTQMMSAMRSTVPDGGLFPKSQANEIFRSLLDQELARAASRRSPFGLAGALTETLQNHLEPSDGTAERSGGAPRDPESFRRTG